MERIYLGLDCELIDVKRLNAELLELGIEFVPNSKLSESSYEELNTLSYSRTLFTEDNVDITNLTNQEIIEKMNYRLVGRSGFNHDLDSRKAYLETIITLKTLDGEEYFFKGIQEGYISLAEHGEDDLAYNKIFIPKEYKSRHYTIAELSTQQKQEVFQTTKAYKSLIEFIKQGGLDRWAIYDIQIDGVRPGYITRSFKESLSQIKEVIERITESDEEPITVTSIDDIVLYGYYPIQVSIDESLVINLESGGLLTSVKGLDINPDRVIEAINQIN